MHQRSFFVLALPLLLAAPASAQLARHGQLVAARPQLARDDVPALVLPHPDVERMRAEDDANPSGVLRYGAVIPVTLSCDDTGRWEQLSSGEIVWRLHLQSPGARSLGLLFREYELPDGGELYVHGADGAPLGAFTGETRQENGMLAVQPVLGEELWVEYFQAPGVSARPRLVIGEVVHDYRGILQERLDKPRRIEAGCLFDINCPQGADYQDIKRSVIMVIHDGLLCSAGMLNNTSNDGTPYFLTANHCGNMTNVVAFFSYENTTCGGGGASTSQTLSGATLLAASGFYDSQLYRLNSTPPQSYQPFFAGWDRGTTQPGPAISISHPSGNPKKLALDQQPPLNEGTQWEVQWELGTLEGGSSGSPLFNGLKRAIGPACCVTLFGCSGQSAFYGRFGAFYDRRTLGRWLDPAGTGSTSIDGHDPYHAQAIPYDGSGSNPNIYSSTNLPSLGTVWNATIDTLTLPSATSTWIIGHAAKSSGIFVSSGELLVDLGTPRVFQSVAGVAGGLSLHANAIPNDPLLFGQIGFTQGVVFLGGGVRQLTNGIELRLR